MWITFTIFIKKQTFVDKWWIFFTFIVVFLSFFAIFCLFKKVIHIVFSINFYQERSLWRSYPPYFVVFWGYTHRKCWFFKVAHIVLHESYPHFIFFESGQLRFIHIFPKLSIFEPIFHFFMHTFSAYFFFFRQISIKYLWINQSKACTP